jgi:MFS family permease
MSARGARRFAVFGNRDFGLYLVARFLGTLAVQMQTVAVGWQVYEVTRDPLDLGLIGLSQFLPFILSILPAGHLADSRDRRRIVTACYALEFICALLLLAIALEGMNTATPVFAVMTLFGIARAFQMPTGQALLPNLVPREQFGAAVAINSSTWQIATIAGPALGGIVYLAGAPVVYASAAALFAVAVALTLALRAGGRGGPREAASLEALLLGLRFVRSRRVVLGAISLDLFAVLFGGVAAFGAATIVFGLSTSFWLSMLALVAMGAGDMVSIYIRHLLVQLETPDAIRGRVSAVNAVFIGASNELGEFESGVTAAWFGTVPAVIVGGCATLAVAVLWVRFFPELARMDGLPQPAADD